MAVNYTSSGPVGSVAFMVHPTSTQSNLAATTDVVVVFGTEIYDIGANFASNTFTAPVTGKYQLSISLYVYSWDVSCSYVQCTIISSNRNHYWFIADGDLFPNSPTYWQMNHSLLVEMDASDTAYVNVHQSGGGAQMDISTNSDFTGYLAA